MKTSEMLTIANGLIAGLILGVGFPRYIKERRLSRQCITSVASLDYVNWVSSVLGFLYQHSMSDFQTEAMAALVY